MRSPSSVRLVGVAAVEVADIWPRVSLILNPAIKRSGGRLSRGSVLEGLLKRDMQLWLAVDQGIKGAAVTQICIHPTGMKTLSALLVAGVKFDDWGHLWGKIEDWARERGCEKSEIPRGRRGWKRKLKGWNEMVFMEKDL